MQLVASQRVAQWFGKFSRVKGKFAVCSQQFADLVEMFAYTRCFLAQARPEPALRYRLNSSALASSSNEIEQMSCQGLYFAVCGDPSELCLSIRSAKLMVELI